MSDTTTTTAALLDARPLGRLQYSVFALCGAAMLVAGFGIQGINYVIPALSGDMGLSPRQLRPVFAAALWGLATGSFLLAPIADWVGRRPLILGSMLAFGAMTLATALCNNLAMLVGARFLTGLSLGAALPNLIALTAEYSPARLRARVVTLLACGLALGGAAGGLATAVLLGEGGWRSLFVAAGVLTLTLAAVLLATLPESMRFLMQTPQGRARMPKLLRRLDPTVDWTRNPGLQAGPDRGMGWRRLGQPFVGGRWPATLLLWAISFASLLGLYLVATWLPMAVNAAERATGLSGELSLALVGMAMALLLLGQVVGTVALGPLLDRVGAPRVLPWVYALGAACIAGVGYAESSGPLLAVVFGVGFATMAAQNCTVAVAASLYPTGARATGVGWAMTAGWIGVIMVPKVMDRLLRLELDIPHIMLASAVPALLAAVAYVAMGRTPVFRTGRGVL